MRCPICLEETNNNIYLDCTHYLCYNCLTNTQNSNLRFNGCPICRSGESFTYHDIFPDNNSQPYNINNWNNPNFNNLKGQYESATNVELEWITNNWGNLGVIISKDNLIQNKLYVILNYNYYLKGIFRCPSRESENNFIFSECKILDRSGVKYNATPSSRSINLRDNNIKVFNLD